MTDENVNPQNVESKAGGHTKMYGVCENKCFVEVSPKTDTDAVADRVDTLEDKVSTIETEQDTQDNAINANTQGRITGVETTIDNEMKLHVKLTRQSGNPLEGIATIPNLGGINFVNELPSNPVPGSVYGIIPKYGVGWKNIELLNYYLENEIPDDTIYSIIYDKSKASDSYGCLEYADFCEGFEPMTGGNGNADEGDWKEGNTTLFDKIEVGYFDLPPNTGSNWLSAHTIWTKVNKNNVSFKSFYNFTKIPKIYQKIESLDSNRKKLSISLAPFSGATLHPSFVVDGVEKPYTYIGRNLGYGVYSGGEPYWLTSYADGSPTVSLTRAKFRELAQRNDNCNITSYYDRDLVNKLYLFAFKDWNSQKALGAGVTRASSVHNTGGTAGKSWMYGTTDNSEQMSFLGLEDWWGNIYQFIDDYVLYNGTIYAGTNSNPTDNTTGKTAIGSFVGSSEAYPLRCKFGLNDTFISEASGGSATAGICDYQYWNNSGTYIAHAGGGWDYGSLAGAFCLCSNYSVSYSHSTLGARLTYKP